MLFTRKKRDQKTWNAVSRAALMGTNMVASTIVGGVVGFYLDKWLGTQPWMFLFWLIMGIIQGFRSVYLESMKIQRADSQPVYGEPEGSEKPAADGKTGSDGKPEGGGKPDV